MNGRLHDIKQAFRLIPSAKVSACRLTIVLGLIGGLLDLLSLGALLPVILHFIQPQDSAVNLPYALPFLTDAPVGYLLAGITLLFLVKNGLSLWIVRHQQTTLLGIASDLSERLYRQFFAQSYLDYSHDNTALAGKRIQSLPHDFAVHVLTSYLHLLTEGFLAASIVILLLLYSPLLVLLLAVSIFPALWWWSRWSKRRIGDVEDSFKSDYTENTKNLMRGIDSYQEVVLSAKQSFFIDRFMQIKRKMNAQYAWLKSMQQMPSRLLEVVLVIALMVIITFGFMSDLASILPLVAVFVAAFYRIYPSISRIATATTALSSYRFVTEELTRRFAVEERPPEPIDFKNSIRLEEITFAYPNQRPVLNSINLNLEKGNSYAIVGESGAGKSTLVKLLIGLLEPSAGRIVMDDHHIKMPFTISSAGYLSQQPIIIDGTIIDNVAFGEQHPDLEKVSMALAMANLTAFVRALPDGLNTSLGENGVRISGGQIQRICLARLLYRPTDVIILDEVSNNLDTANRDEIIGTLQRLQALGKTLIIIDHDPALLTLATSIWQVANGTVTELSKNDFIQHRAATLSSR